VTERLSVEEVGRRMEAREAREQARAKRRLDKAIEERKRLEEHPDEWGYPPSAYASTFRRAAITPVIIAKAPTRTMRFHIPVDPPRPRRNSRYWLVGLYVIEEDQFGDTWIMSKDQLRAFDPADLVREILPDQHLPIVFSYPPCLTGAALLTVVERSVEGWNEVYDRFGIE